MNTQYPISINKGWSVLIEHITSLHASKVFVLVDENTKESCLPILETNLSLDLILIEITSGEVHKTILTCQHIWDQLRIHNADRKSVLLNLGGGVIGDMGGFCAASYKRGIPFIQIPTSLLAMVDASVGGKLGIDMFGLKNMVGLFKNPSAVFIHTAFLKTLDPQELRSGFAEIIKHGLIADSTYWEIIKRIRTLENPIEWASLISRSIQIKSSIVEKDPNEQGLRKILNFGHTLGHAIESHFLGSDQHLLHGEAIAVGMLLEARLAYQKGLISMLSFDEIYEYICTLYTDTIIELPSLDRLVEALNNDKKNEQNQLAFSLLEDIGSCAYNVFVSLDELALLMEWYKGHQSNLNQ